MHQILCITLLLLAISACQQNDEPSDPVLPTDSTVVIIREDTFPPPPCATGPFGPVEAMPASSPQVLSEPMLGSWQEVIDTSLLYFADIRYQIDFRANNEFSVEVYYFTDVNDPNDPCGYIGYFYATGQVVAEHPLIDRFASSFDERLLLLSGVNTDSTYTQRIATCRCETVYQQMILLTQQAPDTLQLTTFINDSGNLINAHYHTLARVEN